MKDLGKKSSVFTHPFSSFTNYHIKNYAKEKDIIFKDNLESNIWVYELHSQIQKRCGDRCILKGGASTQLHLPINIQRLTNDLDCATDLTSKELFEVMKSIKSSYIKADFYTGYDEYIPKHIKQEGRTIPMMTFIYDIPFHYQTKMRKRYPGLKIDFLFLDTRVLHKTRLNPREVLGLNLNYSPICIDKYSTISDKLITLASTTIGLEPDKIDALYKNIYDLSCLLSVCDDLESFEVVSERMKESLSHEIEMKNGSRIGMHEFLRDVLDTIYFLSLTNMIPEYNTILPTLTWFGEQSFQGEVRKSMSADRWSILCLHLYIWVYALMEYLSSKDNSRLEGINTVLTEYDSYLTLNKKERRNVKAELKKRIRELSPGLNIDATGDPLRLTYINYILTYCKSK